MEEENTTAAAPAAAPDAAVPDATADDAKQNNATAAVVEENAADATTNDDKKDTAAADTKEAASSGRAKRVRKSTTNYVPEEETKKEVIIPVGKGDKLEDMPNVVSMFKDVTWSTPSLKMMYSIVFGVGKKADFKKHLLQFNGLAFPEGQEETEKEKVLQKVRVSSYVFVVVILLSN